MMSYCFVGVGLVLLTYNLTLASTIIPLTSTVTDGYYTITVAGSTNGYEDGIGSAAKFDTPVGVAFGPLSNVAYVSDSMNNVLRKVNLLSGEVSTIAGKSGSSGWSDDIGTYALFNYPWGISVSSDASMGLISDHSNHRIRKIIFSTTHVSTLAGSSSGYIDSIGTAALFDGPLGLALSSDNGFAIVCDATHRIRKITLSTKAVSTIAGSGQMGHSDGIGTNAKFADPTSLAISSDNTFVLVTDMKNKCIRKILLSSCTVSTLYSSASNTLPLGITLTYNDSVAFVTYSGNFVHRLNMVVSDVRRVAGEPGFSGYDDGIGTLATFSSIQSIAVSPDESVAVILDEHRVRVLQLDVAYAYDFREDIFLRDFISSTSAIVDWNVNLIHQKCNWSGVYCDSVGHITSIMLPNYSVEGTIPDSIGYLTKLTALALDRNLLSGSIPHTLSRMISLVKIDLSDNYFVGTISYGISALSNLQVFSLYRNSFSGSLPDSFTVLKSLQYLDVYDNMFEGSLPSSVYSLHTLEFLDLDLNSFTGTLSSDIGKLSALYYLDISRNSLTGSIPKNIGSLSRLSEFRLFSNFMSRSIPSEIGNLQNVADMSFWSNALTGSLPPSMGSMTSLTVLYMGENSFTGSVPDSFANLIHLTRLELYGNYMNAIYPRALCELSALQIFYISQTSVHECHAPTPHPTFFPTTIPSTSSVPSGEPSGQPTSLPSSSPTFVPSGVPSGQPTCLPSIIPTMQPSEKPSYVPTSIPTSQPTSPTSLPSGEPSGLPTLLPTSPSMQPTGTPSGVPSSNPTSPSSSPTYVPSGEPTCLPSIIPTMQPSEKPSYVPTSIPTFQPTSPTSLPSGEPSGLPTLLPTSPSMQPTGIPSGVPSSNPTSPSSSPTYVPSGEPTCLPSIIPTMQPSEKPSYVPTSIPTFQPTSPTSLPSGEPSGLPTLLPTSPSMQPTGIPSGGPSSNPTSPSSSPTCLPSGEPTCLPSSIPTMQPTGKPSYVPTSIPTSQPTSPTSLPSGEPSGLPTLLPTSPSMQPTGTPSGVPSSCPTSPSSSPTSLPSGEPTCLPSSIPTMQPSGKPSYIPTSIPTSQPTSPTSLPSGEPSGQPTLMPTSPSMQPTGTPSGVPSSCPTSPSSSPTYVPSSYPTSPSSSPTCLPSGEPSGEPTCLPSSIPTMQPSGKPSYVPTSIPTSQPTSPTGLPSGEPSGQPTLLPTSPSMQPTGTPSGVPSSCPTSPSSSPTSLPSGEPTCLPSSIPTMQPSGKPSYVPTSIPTSQPTSPTSLPSGEPSGQPTLMPTSPSMQPTGTPSGVPSSCPTSPSSSPTSLPSGEPTCLPSSIPTMQPSGKPSYIPTSIPTSQPTSPTSLPSGEPSGQPTLMPTSPSMQPTGTPSGVPSSCPTSPSSSPTYVPSSYPTSPSSSPTCLPSGEPSGEPTCLPSSIPTMQPSGKPSYVPTSIPTSQPTSPTGLPSGEPSGQPTLLPTSPSMQPTGTPSGVPSSCPTSPSSSPTSLPSGEPTCLPSSIPTMQPSGKPSYVPTSIPTSQPTSPTSLPSGEPSGQPTLMPTSPSMQPTGTPSGVPSSNPTSPSSSPTCVPSSYPTSPSSSPTCLPSGEPSGEPTCLPSSIPTMQPSGKPSYIPTSIPTSQPTSPTGLPSGEPSGQPTLLPTSPSMQPTGTPSGVPSSNPTSPSSVPSSYPTSPSSSPTCLPSGAPSGEPTCMPSSIPTMLPSGTPSSVPSCNPTSPSSIPTYIPSGKPSLEPTFLPSSIPTMQPSGKPSYVPTSIPTSRPTSPTSLPSGEPSGLPTLLPTSPSMQPTGTPSSVPSSNPTSLPTSPTRVPSGLPTSVPSASPTSPTSFPSGSPTSPTSIPSSLPTAPSGVPTSCPSVTPTSLPTVSPSTLPSSIPSSSPTSQPTSAPSMPTCSPSSLPSSTPTCNPSKCPTSSPSGEPSHTPSSSPSCTPTSVPTTSIPSRLPSCLPSGKPSAAPSATPSSTPSCVPSGQPSAEPTCLPSSVPTMQPSGKPSYVPTSIPTSQPTSPTSLPSGEPSGQPTLLPTSPSMQPTGTPSGIPSGSPTSPSSSPTCVPSSYPTSPSSSPTCLPSGEPSGQPTSFPSSIPTMQPSGKPSYVPTSIPTSQPTSPTGLPSGEPSGQPTLLPTSPSMQPTGTPSGVPSSNPTSPSSSPTCVPSSYPTSPSSSPTCLPSGEPSGQPTSFPSSIPTMQPSGKPSYVPTSIPTSQPTSPTGLPSGEPSGQPTLKPTSPSMQPTGTPSSVPSGHPTSPSSSPTCLPSGEPSGQPTSFPSSIPTMQPSGKPSYVPTSIPTSQPTSPTSLPSGEPSGQPTLMPTSPSMQPTGTPSSVPSSNPTSPSSSPTSLPSGEPTCLPSSIPTMQPSGKPSCAPTSIPLSTPTSLPSGVPSHFPSEIPSSTPSAIPSALPTGFPHAYPSLSPSGFPVFRPTDTPAEEPTITLYPTLTFSPTLSPTYSVPPTGTPSLAPSLSFLTQWNEYLEYYESSLATVKRLLYTDLSLRNEQVYGTCTEWRVFVYDHIPAALITHTPSYIALISISNINFPSTSAQAECGDELIVSNVVNEIKAASASASSYEATHVCGNSEWSVLKCDGNLEAVLCVNCSGYCGMASKEREFIHEVSCNHFSASPIGKLTMLVVDFDELSPAPVIKSVSGFSSSTTITLYVELSGTGSLVCAAYYSSTAYVPTATAILLIGNSLKDVATTSAIYKITGLIPASTYDVYCATYSPTEVPMDATLMQNTKTTVDTLCCRSIAVKLNQMTFSDNDDSSAAVTLSVDILPSEYLRISVSAFHEATGTVIYPFLPTEYLFSSASPRKSVSLTYVRHVGGDYVLNITLLGPSRHDYEVVHRNAKIFRVRSTEVEPDPPVLKSAVFSSDGSKVTVLFNDKTNKAHSSVTFKCNELFDFTGIDSSVTCTWVNEATVDMFSTGNSGITVGATLTLNAGMLKSKCTSSVDPTCSSWKYNSLQSVSVAAPEIVDLPRVSISSPAVIGPCDPLTLDLTSSTGTGGRPWSSFSITVESSQLNVSELQAYLNSTVTSVTTPIIIPQIYLYEKNAYNVIVILCNFLHACGRGAHPFVVSSSKSVPVVFINSQSPLFVHRNRSYTVFGSSYTFECDGKKSTRNLHFDWKVYLRGSVQALKSVSVNPREFKLPAYSLVVGELYSVTLTVRHLESLKSSTATMQLFVVTGSIVCVVSGGYDLGMRIDGSAVIDLSSSYDEDIESAFGSNADLKFNFECNRILPSYSSVCGLLMEHISPDAIRVSVDASSSTEVSVRDVFHFRIIASSKNPLDSRTSEVVVVLTVLNSLSPVISLSSRGGTRINPSNKLRLLANIDVKSSGNILWSINDPSISLVDSSLSPISKDIPYLTSSSEDDSIQSVTVSLVLVPNTLPERSSFVFTLFCSLENGFSESSSIEVSTNSPPIVGQFEITPTTGIMLNTTFYFSAFQWDDTDIPITYEFGYESLGGTSVVLRSRQTIAYTSTVLPAGPKSHSNLIRCRVNVYDKLDAFSDASKDVEVNEVEMSLDHLGGFLLAGVLGSEGHADELKNVLATTSSILSITDCSRAPNCMLLNRENCSTVLFTCGNCFDGYVGNPGHANTPCLHADTARRKLTSSTVGTSCSSDLDCEGDFFMECKLDGMCGYIQRTCPNACSGHGHCMYMHLLNSSISLPQCGLLDYHCTARCVCFGGYAGYSCSYEEEDHSVLLDLRYMIAEGIRNLSTLENTDPNTLKSWVVGLASLASDPDDLSDKTKLLMAVLAEDIVERARDMGMTVEELTGIDAVIDFALSASELKKDKEYISLMETYSEFVMNDMVDGQNAVDVVASFFRMSSYTIARSDNAQLSTPKTTLEHLSGKATPYLYIPSAILPLQLTVFEVLDTRNLNSSYLSLPLGVSFEKLPCDNLSNKSCELTVVLHNEITFNWRTMSQENLTTSFVHCIAGVEEIHEVQCLGSSPVVIACNGSGSGEFMVTCPSFEPSASCNAIGSTSSSCQLISYNTENTTCTCTLPRDLTAAKRSSQLASNDDYGNNDERISVEFVAVSDTVVSDFITTWKSTGDLDAEKVGDSWQVLLTCMFIGVVFVLMTVAADGADKRQLKRDKIEAVVENVKPLQNKLKQRLHFSSPSRLVRSKSTQSKMRVQHEFERIEESLPSVLRSNTVWNKFVCELKTYHRWLGIVFYYSATFPRALRVLSLCSNVIIMLFIEALTYNIADPDDGSCESYSNERNCLSEKSSLSNDETMCYWNDNDDVGSCHFREIKDSTKRVVIVAIISAVVSTPFALTVQYVISNILAKNTYSRKANWEYEAWARADESKQTDRAAKVNLSEVCGNSLQEDFYNLITEVCNFREQLTPEQRRDFDDGWGLTVNKDEDEYFTSYFRDMLLAVWNGCSSQSSDSRLFYELRTIRKVVAEEHARFTSVLSSSGRTEFESEKEHISRKLLYLFVKDLLVGVNGQILEDKHRRDEENTTSINWGVKFMAWVFVIILNAALLFYVYLFAMMQSGERQVAWFRSFVIWLIFEIVLASSAVVFVTHLLIPLYISTDVQKVKRKLLADIMSYKNQVTAQHEKHMSLNEAIAGKSAVQFNAAKYLFVSYRLAYLFPDIPESRVISKFSTPWPKRSFKQSKKQVNESYNRRFQFFGQAMSKVAVFFLTGLMNIPPLTQDIIVQLVLTSGLGYVVVLFIQLFRVNPLLPFIPLAAFVIIIHFMVKSGTNDKRVRRMEEIYTDNRGSSSIERQLSKLSVVTPDSTLLHDGSMNSDNGLLSRKDELQRGRRFTEHMLQSMEHRENQLRSPIVDDLPRIHLTPTVRSPLSKTTVPKKSINVRKPSAVTPVQNVAVGVSSGVKNGTIYTKSNDIAQHHNMVAHEQSKSRLNNASSIMQRSQSIGIRKSSSIEPIIVRDTLPPGNEMRHSKTSKVIRERRKDNITFAVKKSESMPLGVICSRPIVQTTCRQVSPEVSDVAIEEMSIPTQSCRRQCVSESIGQQSSDDLWTDLSSASTSNSDSEDYSSYSDECEVRYDISGASDNESKWELSGSDVSSDSGGVDIWNTISAMTYFDVESDVSIYETSSTASPTESK